MERWNGQVDVETWGADKRRVGFIDGFVLGGSLVGCMSLLAVWWLGTQGHVITTLGVVCQ